VPRSTVCPQSLLGVLKNCGAQTNWASHMRFAADHSETLEVFFYADRWNKRPSLRFSVSCLWNGDFFEERWSTWTPIWTCCNCTLYHKLSTYSHKSFCNKMAVLPHWGLQVCVCLDRTFPGRYGPMPWSPHSPDITPLGFFPVGLCQEQCVSNTS
jgi:hypothetical protein